MTANEREVVQRLIDIVRVTRVVDIINDDRALEASGYDPYCVNEGMARSGDTFGVPYWAEDLLKVSNTRVIFLDFDHVLNNDRQLADHGSAYLHEDSVVSIAQLAERVDADIVINSSWRIGSTVEALRTMLMNCTRREVSEILSRRVIDVVPDVPSSNKGDEVRAYLAAHPNVTDYVIFDDDPDNEFDGMLTHLIKPYRREGLRDGHIEMAERHFNRG